MCALLYIYMPWFEQLQRDPPIASARVVDNPDDTHKLTEKEYYEIINDILELKHQHNYLLRDVVLKGNIAATIPGLNSLNAIYNKTRIRPERQLKIFNFDQQPQRPIVEAYATPVNPVNGGGRNTPSPKIFSQIPKTPQNPSSLTSSAMFHNIIIRCIRL